MYNQFHKPVVEQSKTNSREYIVNNEWSFKLPAETELHFNSEHISIMGQKRVVDFVVKGLQYNGRYLFDFNLDERYPGDSPVNEHDVISCRYDNDVQSGNGSQKIIKNGDDLYVDLVSKNAVFTTFLATIRVRGDGIYPWDFSAGYDTSDPDVTAVWEEINRLANELARSIQLLDSRKKTDENREKRKQNETVILDSDFIVAEGVLRKYVGNNSDIVIPEGVKEISDSAFFGLTNLKSVVVPEGVKKIGASCFGTCYGLERCVLPDSLKELGELAFWGCSNLREVYLGDKIETLDRCTFQTCNALRDIKIPNGIKEISEFVFEACYGFKHIVIPDGTEVIGPGAFRWCKNLEYLYIPDSVQEFQTTVLGEHPLEGCEKVTIYAPAGSKAQKFAIKHNIPYSTADKGIVTADNTNARTEANSGFEHNNTMAEVSIPTASMTDDISADQAKYAEYLRQKEEIEREKEKEKERKKT